ncbi:MAG: LysR family transcriptional regulator, partial [Alphaproteobacteria bacterium]|nr:LysR family transcriptional regulator [Alphaproteobacteria bacterium]
MRHVTFRQLQSLLAIKRSGKISQAAQELNLTGPAITLQLKQLEEQLGLPLFDRSREGMRPTVAGDAALRAARDIELRLRSFFEEVDAIRDADTGRLAIGAVSTAKYFAPALIAAFRAKHPGIEIVLSVGNRFGIIDALRQYDIDLALMGRPPRDFGVRSLLFGDHPLVMIAAPDHPLTRRRSLSKEDLLDHKFIVREAGSGTRSSLDIFMSDVSGWQELRHTEMTSNETIKQAVMAGMGIAFISAHTIAMELELGRLKILDVEGMPIRRQWYGVTRSDR